MAQRILVVDDEQGIRDILKQVLEYESYEVRTAASGEDGLSAYKEFSPHVVLLDVKMEGMDGLETLSVLRDRDPDAQVVMISGHGTIQTAVEATQRGAYDFLEKPLDTDRVMLTLRNAISHRKLASENISLREVTAADYELVGESAPMQAVHALIEKVAPTGSRVLITGENGTGKELVARAMHRLSDRGDGPFVEVNCAAIPSELIESELFGHLKGSFTGAIADRAGKFQEADGGTLFMDEVGDMSLAAQSKVLRALQEGVVTRVGSAKPITVDTRVVAATNKDLETEIEAGTFREDLYYRLNVVPIQLPALRDRRQDIPALVDHFVTQIASRARVSARDFSEEATQKLRQRDWPGNVRELRNTVERLLILAQGDTVMAADVDQIVPLRDRAGAGTTEAGLMRCATFEEFKQEAEKTFLASKLDENDWNVSETARRLAMPRSNLYKKIEKYGLQRR